MFGFITPVGVAKVHETGRKVSTWTVDTPEDMAGVVSAGVDAVVSNRVAELVAFLRGGACPRGDAVPRRDARSGPPHAEPAEPAEPDDGWVPCPVVTTPSTVA